MFTYSKLPHEGDWVVGNTVQEAWSLNSPLQPVRGTTVLPEASLFRTNASNVMFDAIKKAEDRDCVLLRLHEFTGQRGELELTSDFKIVSWQECDLMERPTGEVQHEDGIRVELHPYELKTFLIEMGK